MRAVVDKFHSMKLFHKLLLSFAVTIVVPGIISYYITVSNIEHATTLQQQENLNHSVRITTNTLEDLFERISTAVLYVYNGDNANAIAWLDKYEQSTKDYRAKKLKNIQDMRSNSMPIIEDIVGHNLYLTIITSGEIGYMNYDFDASIIKNMISTYKDKGLISSHVQWKPLDYSYSSVTDSSHVSAITCLFDIADRTKTGVIILSISENVIAKLLETDSNTHTKVLLNEEFQIISSSKDSLIGKELSSVLAYSPLDFDGVEGVFEGELIEGIDATYAYKKLEANDWILLEYREQAYLRAGIEESSRQVSLIIVVFVVVFFAIALAITRSITLPINRLSKLMKNTEHYLENFEYQGNGYNEIDILEESFGHMKGDLLQLLKENKEKEKKKREAELKALQAQIRPHFLFNTLNAVRWASINKNNEKAADMVLALNKLLRMSIGKEGELSTLSEEVQYLGHYIDIIKMRHTTEFDLLVDVDESLRDYEIPRLLLQPLVENSIFHGFESMKSGGIITISAYSESEFIVIAVTDNGRGIEIGEAEEVERNYQGFSGIGVSNVDERIRLHYGELYGLKLSNDLKKGTVARIELPKLEAESGELSD